MARLEHSGQTARSWALAARGRAGPAPDPGFASRGRRGAADATEGPQRRPARQERRWRQPGWRPVQCSSGTSAAGQRDASRPPANDGQRPSSPSASKLQRRARPTMARGQRDQLTRGGARRDGSQNSDGHSGADKPSGAAGPPPAHAQRAPVGRAQSEAGRASSSSKLSKILKPSKTHGLTCVRVPRLHCAVAAGGHRAAFPAVAAAVLRDWASLAARPAGESQPGCGPAAARERDAPPRPVPFYSRTPTPTREPPLAKWVSVGPQP
ncbi:collagen alpha-1(I) chain-like [Schistocerca serialis cubense]|uniref:collagen alpha-1(I) chain-like n=1 Tax=Schistocerca serialis cubense TaxID=2023355 RepID=UPI00214E67EC|nr:collagen alpha-1(I) chain-like [Schistocerca serialis cubense]